MHQRKNAVGVLGPARSHWAVLGVGHAIGRSKLGRAALQANWPRGPCMQVG